MESYKAMFIIRTKITSATNEKMQYKNGGNYPTQVIFMLNQKYLEFYA